MNRPSKVALAILAATTACIVDTALAHHSFAAQFDRDRPVQLTGTVTEMKWANPHAWIYMDVEGDDGGVVNWALETRGANNLIRLGWRREDLPAGTVLVVEAFQARNGTPTASIEVVTFGDGRRLFVGAPERADGQ